MCIDLFILLCSFVFTDAKHFNGGTIGWTPINPYDNSSSVKISITQSYSWTYPYIKCLNNVPSSTSGFSSANTNLTCVVDCSTDGGYFNAPIDILTDCTSASSSMNMLTSERSKNISLSADAHFYLAYRGSAWVALNYPSQQGLDWCISYSWTYPYIKCLNNVPSSTSGFSSANTNLTCVVDCSTDGGYFNAPIDILTDCTSASSSMNMLTSERSKNISLSTDAHFYLAYRGSAWVALNYPSQHGLDWCIVTHIDLRKRSDGFINTPPVAKVVSPQYVIVNKTTQINIPVSDANAGDDVRCRWSTYTTGYRRRKRSNTKEHNKQRSDVHFYSEVTNDRESIHIRNRRTHCTNCTTLCISGCPCICPTCDSTCTGSTCNISAGCYTTVATTTINTTTTETPGTPKSTSTFPIRQAVDECADICYPNGVPNDTTLSDCTITFTGTKAGVWYAVAIQVKKLLSIRREFFNRDHNIIYFY
ncbi:unnamed protein product [Rotaria sp. Silwood1]|nr:unnamed protein product [Rotaria sp. Silwood1]